MEREDKKSSEISVVRGWGGLRGGWGREEVCAPAPDSLPACFFDLAHRLSFGPNGASHHFFECLFLLRQNGKIELEKHE